jgi:hypothetical protein
MYKVIGCRWIGAKTIQGRPVTASPLGNTRIQIYAKVQYYDLKVYSFF